MPISCGSQHLLKLSLVSTDDKVALDLSTEALSENCNFNGVLSSRVSILVFLLMTAARSVDNDLLMGGDGDLRFLELQLSPPVKGDLESISLSENIEDRTGFLRFTDEQLLDCTM